MPIWEYICPKCGHIQETIKNDAKCDKCGEIMVRKISAPGLIYIA